jgi:L-fuculose-phosphate aldolase
MSDKGLKCTPEQSSTVAEQDEYGTSFDALLENCSTAQGRELSEKLSASQINVSVIGWVRSSMHKLEDCNDNKQSPEAVLEIIPEFVPGLDGLKPGLTITVFTWLHLADRKTLHMSETSSAQAKADERGVFAASGVNRPNPVCTHQVVIRSIEKQTAEALIRVDSMKALDGTPILDIKCNFQDEVETDENLTDFKKNLVSLCARAHSSGLMDGFNGNASLRCGNLCIITSSGSAKGALLLTDFAILDIESGSVLSGKRPSSEIAMHLQIYRSQPEAMVILHTHPPKLTALGLRLSRLPMQERLKMPITESGVARFLCATVLPLPAGSEELAAAVALGAKTRQAVWMEGHGLCVWGADLSEVFGISEELEHLAYVRILAGVNCCD